MLTTIIAGTAAWIWFGGAWTLHRMAAPVEVPWPVLAVAFALTEVLLIHFEFRTQSQALTLGELPLLVGVVFCSPAALLVARLCGSVAALVGYFHQAHNKLAFNLAMHATKVAVAVGVYRVVLGHASPSSHHGWLAAFAAAGAADMFSHVCIYAAITLTAGRPTRAMVGPMVVTCVAAATTNTCLALLTVEMLWHDASSAWLLVAVAGVFALGYRALAATRRRYANLELLYRFTRTLSASREAAEVVTVVLEEARTILRADAAELALVVGKDLQRSTLDDEGNLVTSVEPLRGTLEALVLGGSKAVLAPRGAADGAVRDALAKRGLRDAMAAPITGADGTVGVLVVADRLGEVATFDKQDLRLFETLANHAGVALHGGQLLERLRQEVAAKEHQALHDQLTSLPNRTLFAMRVNEALEAARPADTVAVMLMDLDQFKEVNDTLGHHTGDALLKETAVRLVRTLGARGTIARLGGDEFAIVVPRANGVAEAIAVAGELRAAIGAALSLDDVVLQAQASVGIALAPEHGTDASGLLQRADVAMYAAKGAQTGSVVYSAEHDHYSERRLTLVRDLRHAIANAELELHYQPQLAIASGAVLGVEALMRWRHPEYGWVPPDEFIPLAEHAGIICDLTGWLLETALGQLRRWSDDGIEISMAVNLSARGMADPGLCDEIDVILARTGCAPSRLVLELTESTMMTDFSGGLETLQRLAASGIQLAIDDFGTGYSSLSRLARLPVDEVKIDQSFVIAIGNDANAATIVRSTIDLARNLGMRTVAEGVEDIGAWRMLAALGCDAAQGYLMCRPIPSAEIDVWLREWTDSALFAAITGGPVLDLAVV